MNSTKKNSTPKTPFDDLISSTHLDIMKLLLPLIPPNNQGQFALYIKFQELQETARFFKRYPNGLHSCGFDEFSHEPSDMFSTIKHYLPEENRELFDNISNIMHMMEMMRQMQEVSNMSGEDSSMDFLKNMLSPEQQEIFNAMNQMYDMDNMSSADSTTEPKGSDSYE